MRSWLTNPRPHGKIYPGTSFRMPNLGLSAPQVDTIVQHLVKHVRGGDIVCVFSNGGFGGIHQKLLGALK